MKVKFFFLSALVVLSLQNLQAKTLIVSDIDDTIKATDILGSKSKIVFNGIVRKTAFSGMSELYQEFSKNNATIYYVSGSPKIIRSRVSEFLEENNFPQEENIILKNKLSEDTIEYKTTAIRELIKKNNPDTLILIGDDGEFDPQVYAQITKEYPTLTTAVYIHAITNRAGVEKSFFSAVEIAGFEILEGRLAESALAQVTKGFVKQTNRSVVSIKKRFCPKEGSAGLDELISKLSDPASLKLLETAQEKVQRNCRNE